MENLALTSAFWRDKRVLLTGHTGFKGSWLTLWLQRLGAKVTGISLPPMTSPSVYSDADIGALCSSHFCDIRDVSMLAELIRAAQPEIVFHLAAQALVRAGYRQPLATFETNTMGTAHVLDALRGLESVRVAVMVTTDKVYRDHESRRPYREGDALGGHDPYGASKAASEIVVASYRASFLAEQGVAVASARSGNVIGGGDWSDDRLIPDAVRAWQDGQVLQIRRPHAVRPWQYVLEPLAGYLTLAHGLWERSVPADAYNFGPDPGETVSVGELAEMARRAYGRGEIHYGDGKEGPHESAWLTLDAAEARTMLGVTPTLTLAQAVNRAMAWYRAQKAGTDARALCDADIFDFEQCALKKSATARISAVDRKVGG